MNKNDLKRMVIIFIMIIVGISVSAMKKNREIGDAVQVATLPVSGKVVILDAGHGTPDERCGK